MNTKYWYDALNIRDLGILKTLNSQADMDRYLLGELQKFYEQVTPENIHSWLMHLELYPLYSKREYNPQLMVFITRVLINGECSSHQGWGWSSWETAHLAQTGEDSFRALSPSGGVSLEELIARRNHCVNIANIRDRVNGIMFRLPITKWPDNWVWDTTREYPDFLKDLDNVWQLVEKLQRALSGCDEAIQEIQMQISKLVLPASSLPEFATTIVQAYQRVWGSIIEKIKTAIDRLVPDMNVGMRTYMNEIDEQIFATIFWWDDIRNAYDQARKKSRIAICRYDLWIRLPKIFEYTPRDFIFPGTDILNFGFQHQVKDFVERLVNLHDIGFCQQYLCYVAHIKETNGIS